MDTKRNEGCRGRCYAIQTVFNQTCQGMPIDEVLRLGGWFQPSVFLTHYNLPINTLTQDTQVLVTDKILCNTGEKPHFILNISDKKRLNKLRARLDYHESASTTTACTKQMCKTKP